MVRFSSPFVVECQLTVDEETREPSKSFVDLVVDLLFRTYPYYTDRTSRKAVQECLEADCLYPPHSFKLLDVFQQEASKPGLAPINAFVLVEWGSILLQRLASKGIEAFKDHGLQVVQAHARALELVLSTSLHAKDSVHRSAVMVTRRTLRKVLSGLGEFALAMVVENLTAKGQTLGIKAASFLGVLAGVCSRLKEGIAPLGVHKEAYYNFYVREVLGARSLVPKHLASALNDFFLVYTTCEDLRISIIPTLEKSLLRAPEVILNDLMTPLFGSISNDIDVALILSDNLSKPLLSNLKSSNPSIRDGASSAFSLLLDRSHERNALGKIIDDILLPMSTPKLSVDHRALHARILAKVPAVSTKAKKMSETLCAILSKERNEMAIASEISTLLCQSQQLPNEDTVTVQMVVGTCVKGLQDKRPGVRRQWILGVGQALWSASEKEPEVISGNAQISRLAADCLPCLIKITEEVIRNPITAVSSGLAVAPLMTLSLCEKSPPFFSDVMKTTIRKARLMETICSTEAKTATLLNPRVYMKLSDPDVPWQIRALLASSSELKGRPESDVASAWSQAVIYLISNDDHAKNREMATSGLTKIYLGNRPDVAKIMINGLWTCYRTMETGQKDTSATAISTDTGMRRLQLIIRSISQPYDEDERDVGESSITAMQAQLIDMLVLCRPEILPQVHWIQLCLRIGEDPGLIAESYPERCLQKIESCLTCQDGSPSSRNIHLAVYNTAAELAFVSPEAILPPLLKMIDRDLPVDEVSKCGSTEAAIARTPEGIAFIDVIGSQNQRQAVEKNSKDYTTVKWEEEMRDQIAKKKGQERRLTADEKAKLNTQLVKEANVRQAFLDLKRRLTNGIGYIHALAVGPPTEAIMWISPCLQGLIYVIGAGVAHLVGDSADETYLTCSSFVSSRLGFLRRFIGVATLRMLGSNLSPDLQQESLKGSWVKSLSCCRTDTKQISSLVSCIVCISLGSRDPSMQYLYFTCYRSWQS